MSNRKVQQQSGVELNRMNSASSVGGEGDGEEKYDGGGHSRQDSRSNLHADDGEELASPSRGIASPSEVGPAKGKGKAKAAAPAPADKEKGGGLFGRKKEKKQGGATSLGADNVIDDRDNPAGSSGQNSGANSAQGSRRPSVGGGLPKRRPSAGGGFAHALPGALAHLGSRGSRSVSQMPDAADDDDPVETRSNGMTHAEYFAQQQSLAEDAIAEGDEGEEDGSGGSDSDDSGPPEQIESSVTCIAIHPTQPILALGCSPDIIKIYNLKTQHFVSGIRHSGRITALAFSTDGKHLCSSASWESEAAGWTHSLRLWSVSPKTFELRPAQGLLGQEDLELPDEKYPNIPRLSGNAIRLALQEAILHADQQGTTVNSAIAVGKITGGAMGGKATTDDLLANNGVPPLQNLHQDPISCLQFMPLEENPCIKLLDENGVAGIMIVASGSADRTVRLWCYDKQADVTIHVLRQHKAEVTCISFSPDGRMLMSGSIDGTVICWRITLEPVYETKLQSDTSASSMGSQESGGGPGDESTQSNRGRMVSCVPLVLQNVTFQCSFDNHPSHSIESVYCLQFFPTYSMFGKNKEYTVAVGTSQSLVMLRVHDLRVHESPLTSMPGFLAVVRRFQRHSRFPKIDKNSAAALEAEEEEEKEAQKLGNSSSADRADKMEKKQMAARAYIRSSGGDKHQHKSSARSLGLKQNYMRLAMLHRQQVDTNRYGAIRSLAVGVHDVDRQMAYDLEDSLDAKHLTRSLLSVSERQVKILLTNHENHGHTLAWTLNEEMDQRTMLPKLSPHFCVLGQQNHPTQAVDARGRLIPIPNGQGDEHERGNFLGNFCEQILLPSVVLRRKFDRFGLQREHSAQISAFVLNAHKGESHALDDGSLALASDHADTGNGVRMLKFNLEASVDFPGDIEPTISSKDAYMAGLREVAMMQAMKRISAGGGSSALETPFRISGPRLLGNANPDFIGRLSVGHDLEPDLPAFVTVMSARGVPPNEAKRLAEYQKMMGIIVYKYQSPQVVFRDAEPDALLLADATSKARQQAKKNAMAGGALGSSGGSGGGGGKKMLSSTVDASGFVTAEADLRSGGDSAPSSSLSKFGAGRSANHGSADGFMEDVGLASSKHLVDDDADIDDDDESQGAVAARARTNGRASRVRYAKGTEAVAAAAASAAAAAALARSPQAKLQAEYEAMAAAAAGDAASTQPEGRRDPTDDDDGGGGGDVVQWRGAGKKYVRFAGSNSSGGANRSAASSSASNSKLANFKNLAAPALAPKKKETATMFGRLEGDSSQTGGDTGDGTTGGKEMTGANGKEGRGQCATGPDNCNVQ